MIDEAAKYAIPVKPIAMFQKQFETLFTQKHHKNWRLLVAVALDVNWHSR